MSDKLTPRNDGSKLPSTGKRKEKGTALDRIRAATPAKVMGAPTVVTTHSKADLSAAIAKPLKPRLVFAIDATASREASWAAARQQTDFLFTQLPGTVDVALAVHGGSDVHTFTAFGSKDEFRREADAVSCRSGTTQLIPILRRAIAAGGVKVVTYIGDHFEESYDDAVKVATEMRARGIKAVMLHDMSNGSGGSAQVVFKAIAEITGGAYIDFYNLQPKELRDLYEAIAVLAGGGVKMLEQRRKELPGAARLLPHLK